MKNEIDEVVASGKRRPKLIVIRVGEDPASKTYVKNKIKACEYTGNKWCSCLTILMEIKSMKDAYYKLIFTMTQVLFNGKLHN